MADNVQLMSRGGTPPAYLHPEALSTFPDLRLISNDGMYFELNRAVFASLSNLVVHFRDDEDHFAISTELSRDDLEIVVKFILTGCFPYNQDINDALIANFGLMGIDLRSFNLEKHDTGIAFVPESMEVPWRDNNPSLKFEWVSHHTRQKIEKGRKRAANMDGEVVEAPKHMMIKLEPNFETMAEDDEDQHIVRGRRHVTVIKEEIEDPDSDYYEHLPDDAEEYFDDDELDYVPKKRSRGRPKRSGSPSFTRKRIKREGGTRRPKDGRKIWKIMPDDGVRNPNMKYQCKDCPFGTKTPFAIVQHEFHHKNPGRDDELYHCVVCLQGFEKDSLLQKHHKEVHNDIIYTCEFCERKFNKDRYAVYIEHLKQMHNVGDNKVTYFCIHCGMGHNLQSTLRNHIRRMGPHHSKKCVQCEETFETFIDHETHVKKEHEGNWKYICGMCDKVFDTKKKRNRHRNMDHESRYESKFCDLCGKYVKLIVQHKQVVHGIGMDSVEGGTHVCKECGKAYKYKVSLDKHVETAHCHKTEEEKRAEREAQKVICATCGKTYQTNAGLQFHIAKSHAPKEELPFRCAYCPKAFLHKYHLDNHENQQHKGIRNFKCGLCDKYFAVKNTRDKHERFVCKKVLNYPCELCPKKFSSNTKRDHHILSVHTEDSQKPFQCSYCSKGFATKFTLSEHENTHTNARPNLCPICGMGFNNQASRNAHVKNKHPKEKPTDPNAPVQQRQSSQPVPQPTPTPSEEQHVQIQHVQIQSPPPTHQPQQQQQQVVVVQHHNVLPQHVVQIVQQVGQQGNITFQ